MREYTLEDEILVKYPSPGTAGNMVVVIFRFLTQLSHRGDEHPEYDVQITARIPEDAADASIVWQARIASKDKSRSARLPWAFTKVELCFESVVPIKRLIFTFRAKTILEQVAGV